MLYFLNRPRSAFFAVLLAALATSPVASAITSDTSEELPLLETQAERGDPLSQFELGRLYASNSNGIQSHRLAYEWHKRAAKQGKSEAYSYVGESFLLGRGGVEKDLDKALY